MIKKLIFLVVAVSVLRLTGLLPFASSDVAELVPVQALVVSKDGSDFILDGGLCRGYGTDWNSALQDLKDGAEGHVFLGTADHVILCGAAVSVLTQVIENQLLRPAASICYCPDGGLQADEAARFLEAHDPGVTLQQVRALRLREAVVTLPVLEQTEGGLRLRAQDR